jgi:undecaprenyl-diphosphatase
MIASITDWILSLGGGWALAVVFLGPALESSAFVGIVFPGEIAVILGGVLAYDGRVSLPAVIVAAVAGAIVGDTVGYWVGREWGHQVLRWIGHRLPFLEHRIDDDLERARSYIRRRGGVAVLIGRFAAALRATVPGLAGMSEMHYPTFLAFNALGGAIWGTAFVLLGYFAGAAWERAASDAGKIGFGVLALIVLGLIGSRVLRNVREQGEPLPDRLARVRPAAWFRRMYPSASGWLARRVDTSTVLGFALSLSLAVFALSAWLFGAMAEDVIAHNEAALLDPRIARYVAEHASSSVLSTARAIAWLGSIVVVLPAVVIAVGWFARRAGSWRTAGAFGLALPAASLLARAAHLVVAQAPAGLAGHPATTPSPFPSVGAAQAAAGWATVAILVAFERSFGPRALIGATSAVLVVVVAVAEVVRAAAWYTDALAGVGASAAAVCVIAARGRARADDRRGTGTPAEALRG